MDALDRDMIDVRDTNNGGVQRQTSGATAEAFPAEPAPAEAETAHGEAGQAATSGGSALPQEELDRLTADLIAAFKSVYDPEIPVDIYELGLIYRVDINDDRKVLVDMTLTAPACPVAGEMPGWVENAVLSVEGVESAEVRLTFDPPWDPSRMSDEARLELNMF
jgi:FeS assembly SUF system protein